MLINFYPDNREMIPTCCFTSGEPCFDSWFCVSLGVVGSFEVICLALLKCPLDTSAILFCGNKLS